MRMKAAAWPIIGGCPHGSGHEDGQCVVGVREDRSPKQSVLCSERVAHCGGAGAAIRRREAS